MPHGMCYPGIRRCGYSRSVPTRSSQKRERLVREATAETAAKAAEAQNAGAGDAHERIDAFRGRAAEIRAMTGLIRESSSPICSRSMRRSKRRGRTTWARLCRCGDGKSENLRFATSLRGAQARRAQARRARPVAWRPRRVPAHTKHTACAAIWSRPFPSRWRRTWRRRHRPSSPGRGLNVQIHQIRSHVHRLSDHFISLAGGTTVAGEFEMSYGRCCSPVIRCVTPRGQGEPPDLAPSRPRSRRVRRGRPGRARRRVRA